MVRKEVVQSLVGYFKSEQWQNFMKMLTQTDDPMLHIHIYCENSLEPDSLARLVAGYHEKKGMPLDRGIKFSGVPGVGFLINVQPVDAKTGRFLANYELFWVYNPDVLLASAERPRWSKTGYYTEVKENNLWGWGKKYLDNYYKHFDFKCVGPNEEVEIRRYFKSDHFKKWVRLMEDSPADHVHCNVEINFDPWILKVYAEEAFRELGLKVDWVVPSVYMVPSGYRGKLIFLGAYPEWQHDIAWDYNPDVVIRPTTKPFVGARIPADGDFTFDCNFHSDFEAVVAAGKHVKLTNEEIKEVLSLV